jgi:hypothetical protein
LGKLVLKRIYKNANPQTWLPQHQFGFRKAHSTIQQCHRLTDIINKALEVKQYCTAVFLDVSHAFDEIWHPGLLYKIKHTQSPGYFSLLKSYLQHRHFVTKFNNGTSSKLPMLSGVPQGSILGPLLYTIYTVDLPTSNKTILSKLADETAIFTTHPDPTTASFSLQDHLNNIEKWFRKWKLKINENTSAHINFSLRQGQCPPIYINQTIVPHEETVKYLGLYFDRRLTWKVHIVTERKQLLHKTRELKWLIGKSSLLSLENKLPYFSIDNAHLMYNAHLIITLTSKCFDIPFDVYITRMTLTSGRVWKYRPLLTGDAGVIPKNMPGY